MLVSSTKSFEARTPSDDKGTVVGVWVGALIDLKLNVLGFRDQVI